MANADNKIKLLLLWDILCQMTDEEHPLNTDEIIALLAQKGVKVARKVLREDIKLLNEYGFEVMEVKKKYYYYYVANRPFESAEVALLADVVSASKLNANQKKTLIGKLAGTLGNNKAAVLLNYVISFEKPKRTNPYMIYSVDRIETAIGKNKKISFLYFSLDHNGKRVYRKEGERYLVNPLVMIWNQDNYYLLCYDDKHPGLGTYRIDRMADVSVEQEERLQRQDLNDFNPQEYRSQVFSMFGGEVQKVELQFPASMIDDIFDKFGESICIRQQGTDDFRTMVLIQASKTFYAWVAGSQGKVRICSPQKVKEAFQAFVDQIKANY